jgi:hypothetical protein
MALHASCHIAFANHRGLLDNTYFHPNRNACAR